MHSDLGNTNFLQNWTGNYWHQLGAPKEKLVIGMGLYGRTFTLADPAVNELGSPTIDPGTKGEITGEEGFISQYEVRNRPTTEC